MKAVMVSVLALAVAGGPSTMAKAQRGMGDRSGVAQQAVKPKVITLSGKLVEIKTGPCEKTTGRSPIGTHLMLQPDQGERLNIHLGPEAAVADTVVQLKVGQQITVKAFRTEKMPENHYTAQSLSFDQTTVELRDAGLRPLWVGPGRGHPAAKQPSATKETAPEKKTDAPPAKPLPPGTGRGRWGGGPPPWAGRGQGWRGGRGGDAVFAADREIFHSLLEDHEKIRRTVTKRSDGIETVTESDDPLVAQAIQGHVAAMHDRIKKVQPIHMRDPLFAAVFGNASKITMEVTKTDKGVRVVSTSADPYVVKLIQAHAEVVGKFVANGFPEARQNHPVPEK